MSQNQQQPVCFGARGASVERHLGFLPVQQRETPVVWELGNGSWNLGTGSWEPGVGSWDLVAGISELGAARGREAASLGSACSSPGPSCRVTANLSVPSFFHVLNYFLYFPEACQTVQYFFLMLCDQQYSMQVNSQHRQL